jgi:Holliday junction DNA helicase RuvB
VPGSAWRFASNTTPPTTGRRYAAARPGFSAGPSHDAGAAEIARRGRGTPRLANRLLKRVRDYSQVRHSGAIDEDIAAEALAFFEVDHLGLDWMDVKILRTLAETFSGRPVGLNTLASAVGEEPDSLEDVYEPFLLQLGLLIRTPKGRQATQRAYEHLGLEPPVSAVDQQGLF